MLIAGQWCGLQIPDRTRETLAAFPGNDLGDNDCDNGPCAVCARAVVVRGGGQDCAGMSVGVGPATDPACCPVLLVACLAVSPVIAGDLARPAAGWLHRHSIYTTPGCRHPPSLRMETAPDPRPSARAVISGKSRSTRYRNQQKGAIRPSAPRKSRSRAEIELAKRRPHSTKLCKMSPGQIWKFPAKKAAYRSSTCVSK